ncbi:hypothetical protein [Scytonema sp. NUACC26]|uniref:hypothetical protein n=1 Tax=Scytonema sp. NUACC26 TaxID=3140176 RepID=UPI0034DC529B
MIMMEWFLLFGLGCLFLLLILLVADFHNMLASWQIYHNNKRIIRVRKLDRFKELYEHHYISLEQYIEAIKNI